MAEKSIKVLEDALRANNALLAVYEHAIFDLWRRGEYEASKYYDRLYNELINVVLSIDNELHRQT